MSERPRILALFGGAVLFGQERGNIEVLAALKDQDCQVLCLIRDDDWSVSIPAELDARGLEWVKVPYIEQRLPGRMPHVLMRNPFVFLRANWRFWQIARFYGPTHVHAFNQFYVLNFLPALALVRVPMIFRLGDEPTVHNWIWRTLWKAVLARVHSFVANSRFVAESLRNSGVSDDRITVIYNLPPKRPRVHEPLPPLPDEPGICRIAYVGQISEHKGVLVLIDAFRKLADEYPGARLVIAGRISDWSGDDWARRLRDETVNDPLVGPRVFFLGEISDVPGLLARSHVHVAPSLFSDPSPNVLMEAKQARCPSVVFPRGGMPELVDHGVDGFICREATSDSLAEALSRYLERPELSRSHGAAAFESLNRLGVQQFSQRWLGVYMSAEGPRSRTVAFQARHDSRR